MKPPPVLETPRLILRPFVEADAPALAKLAGAREIADTTITVPHPYSEAQGREWIKTHPTLWQDGRGVIYAITEKPDGPLVGSIGLRDLDSEHRQAELGFWIGVSHWGCGYALEAVEALLALAFGELGLNRICAHHLVRNSASGRVLEKAGFRREGRMRQRVRKWGVFEDVVLLARLREDRKTLPGRGSLSDSPPTG